MQGLQIDVADSPLCLEAVKKLWKANAHTLGFFPDGAFQDAFARGWILGAMDRNARLAGYLLYRVSKGVATIVHLCVAKELRGEGVARSLVERLIEITGNCRGIALKCRRDFPASGLWPQLGFTLQGEVSGRGKHRKPLLCWWRDQKNVDLFSDAAARLRESKVCAVIDANVLFDLMHEELEFEISSNALRADWLADTLELFITEEIFIEIDRNPDPVAKRKNRAFAATFPCLPCDNPLFDRVREELRPLFGESMTEQDQSDLRQLARAIASDATFFVTRDTGLSRLAEAVEKQWGMVILTPTELIVRLDELRRASDYQPVRFAGTRLQMRRISRPQEVSERLCNQERGEKKGSFEARLAGFLARPDTYVCSALLEEDGEPLALTVTTQAAGRGGRMEVLVLRVAKGRLAATLARQMIRQCILLARKARCQMLVVTERFLGSEAEIALSDLGFLRVPDGWLKISLHVVERGFQIAERVIALGGDMTIDPERLRKWHALLCDPNQLAISEFASDQEHVLWPAKMIDTNLPSYIVSIRPDWAQQLFDDRLANQYLFGRKLELALNTEGAYYRSAGGPRILAPGRILWYVSEGRDRDIVGPKHLRACSRLDNVEVGMPKDLYRKYQHLGIYDWAQVYETANFDLNQEIMVLRFSDTEPFPHPVHWERLQELLREEGVTSQLQSPLPISASLFVRLYTEGVGE